MKSGTALIVDDSPDARELFSLVVAEAGYRVLCAESVQEALGILRARMPIDLAIIDYCLEDGTGTGLVHQAVTEGCFDPRSTPTFICTVYRYVELPPDVVMLRKPVEPSALLQAIQLATPKLESEGSSV